MQASQVLCDSSLQWQYCGNGLVSLLPQCRQHVRERGFFLVAVPGSFWKLHQTVAEHLEPSHDHAVQEESHGRRATHRQTDAVGGIFQAQILLAVFEGAFDGPTVSVGSQDLANVPVEVGAVEQLVGAFAE